MNKARWARAAIITIAGILVTMGISSPVQAEDLKGRWYFGGNISYLSTTDDIRNNATIIIGSPGDDGIPFTGDPNEDQGCPEDIKEQSVTLFCDPRGDDLLSREGSIEETFKIDFTAGYGMTSWLSLQLDVSYFKGEVQPLDAFRREALPVAEFTGSQLTFIEYRDFDQVIPTLAGDITEIPVSLTGIVRFRKDSPLNPYIGLGAGIIFAEMEQSGELEELNERLDSLRVVGITDEFGNDLTSQADVINRANGTIKARHPIHVDVEDAFEWHAAAGAEYFFNDRISMVFDVRYMFADQVIDFDLAGEDQVNYTHFSEGLFHSDGSVKLWNDQGQAPNPQEDVNGNPIGLCDRDSVGDFDGNGLQDACYSQQAVGSHPSRRGSTQPLGVFVVQGGEIDLTGLSIGVGVRWHF